MAKRILSLDGGGVRGVIELAFLERIEALLQARSPAGKNARLADYFDLIGGTSTGSIIASALATGRAVDDVSALYDELAPKVFRRNWWRLTGFQSRFDAKHLAKLLDREFPDYTLEDPRIRTRLALVAKRVDTGAPWILSNIPTQPFWNDPPGQSGGGNRRYPLARLIRASTAAPYYFGPERLEIELGVKPGIFVDGGVTPYNNPSVALLMLAKMRAFGLTWPTSRDELLFISIGAGSFRTKISPDALERKPAVKFALDTIVGLIGDCQASGHMLMQWLSHSTDPWVINSEIGDLRDDHLAGVPLMTYQRYDIVLELNWLRDQLGFQGGVRDVAKLRAMDDPGIMRDLRYLAGAAAKKQVRAEHFASIFDK